MGRAERAARLEELLDELSIRHLRKSKAYQLSGGERRRLACHISVALDVPLGTYRSLQCSTRTNWLGTRKFVGAQYRKDTEWEVVDTYILI